MHDEIVVKIEKGIKILSGIEHNQTQTNSKEIMDGIKLAKEVLINPYFSEEGEGKKIINNDITSHLYIVGRKLKYIINMKDTFL